MDGSDEAQDRAVAPETEELARLNLVGESEAFRAVVRLIRQIAACDATTLIEGETGTGKEVAARAIHYLGPRRECPFVPVNCGALPDGLLESELFGHERGAFTDAKLPHRGLVAQADGGTLFLDEVETMSARAQVVMLRFLQDRKYRPVGGRVVASANVRVVAASNAPLGELADRSLFRRDLLFRLRVLDVRLPPLRDRPGDAALLARTFLERLSRLYLRPPKRLHPEAIRWLEGHDWPGNVRELESLLVREFLLGDGDEIRLGGVRREARAERGEPDAASSAAHLPPAGAGSPPADGFKEAKARAVAEFEKGYLRQLLIRARGNISLAARLSGKDRSALNRLLRKHRLAPEPFREGGGRALPDADRFQPLLRA